VEQPALRGIDKEGRGHKPGVWKEKGGRGENKKRSGEKEGVVKRLTVSRNSAYIRVNGSHFITLRQLHSDLFKSNQ